jgi:hypothetical protein
MPVFKVTTLFQYASNSTVPTAPIRRTGGFSETWYATANSVSALVSLFNGTNVPPPGVGYWVARAALLPQGSAIVGYRVQQVSPLGPIQTGALNLAGTVGNIADTPQTTLLLRSPSIGFSNIRRWFLHAIPDAQIVDGEYAPTAAFNALFTPLYFAMVGLQFAGRDLTQPKIPIVSITTLGVVNLQVPYAGAVNDMVRVLRTVDSGKNLRGGRFQVTAIGPGNSVTLSSWPYGATTLGSLRKEGVVYPTVDTANTAVSRVIIKKTGRPIIGYRGRRSKRRG